MKPLASLDDVAARTKGQADPTNLAMVNALDYASGVVRSYTGQTFELVEGDIVDLSGTGTYSLQLPQLPVLDTPVVVTKDTADVVVVNPTSFLTRLHEASGLLYRIDATWPIGIMNLEVTYSHGYLLPGETYAGALPVQPIPKVIRATTASIAASLYALDPTGAVSLETIGNYTVNYAVPSGVALDLVPFLMPLGPFRVVDAA